MQFFEKKQEKKTFLGTFWGDPLIGEGDESLRERSHPPPYIAPGPIVINLGDSNLRVITIIGL